MTKENTKLKEEFEKMWYSDIESGSTITVQRGAEKYWSFISHALTQARESERERIKNNLRKHKYVESGYGEDVVHWDSVLELLHKTK